MRIAAEDALSEAADGQIMERLAEKLCNVPNTLREKKSHLRGMIETDLFCKKKSL